MTDVPRRLVELGHRKPDLLEADLPRSAVLMLLWHDGVEEFIALTRRSEALRVQPGQVSLPGGRCEVGETPEHTAVRETVEELGIDPASIQVVGRFDDAWTVAGFLMAPVVAWHSGVPAFRPDPNEVAAVLEVPIAELIDPATHREIVVQLGELDYPDDILTIRGDGIVGVTADLLVDLVHWLRGEDRRRGAVRAQGLRWFVDAGTVRPTTRYSGD